MSMKCILIELKFNMDINNDKWLKTIWKHREKKKWLIVIDSLLQHGVQISIAFKPRNSWKHLSCVKNYWDFGNLMYRGMV
jgi:hypothetical protein